MSLNYRSRLSKNFMVYVIGAILMKGVSFIISPIIMRLLTPCQYGLLALVTNFIEVIFTCAGLGLRQLLTIEYFHHDLVSRKNLINDILVTYAFVMIPVFLIFILGQSFLNRFIFAWQADWTIIIFALLVAFIRFFADIFYQLLQFLGESLKFVFVQVLAAIIIFSLNLFFLYYFKLGVFSAVLSQFIGVLIVLIIAIFFYLRNYYHATFDLACSLSKIWWYVSRGLPFVPRLLFSWILAVADRWVLAKYVGFEAVGIYSVADMFAQLFQLIFILPFTYAYIPHMLEKFTKNKNDVIKLDNKNLKNMAIIMGVLGFLLIILFRPVIKIFSPIICKIITQEYMGSLDYVFGLLLGQVFLLGAYFASIFLQYQKRVYFTVLAIFVPAIFNIFVNILFVPKYGITASVYATLASYALYFFITIFYNFYAKFKSSKNINFLIK